MRGFGLIAGLFAFVAAASVGRADSPQNLPDAQKATALVRILTNGKPTAYGSAFCIDPSGIFITNAHVADGKSDVDLVLEPGEKAQRVEPAKVLRSDAKLDLAIVQATGGAPFSVLSLGKSDALTDTQQVTALGYPFGAAMALDSDGYPSVSVNTGRITSLRKKEGELQLIQVDASLNPGNSGGPVLDATGNVIGIVQSGIQGAGMNFAIPVDRLSKLLKEPLVSITPGTLDYDKKSSPQAIVVKVVSLEHPTPVYTVELSLQTGDAAPRVLSGKTQSDGTCTFNASLAPSGSQSEQPLRITARFPDGMVIGRASDGSLKIGDDKVSLSQLQRLTFGADGTASAEVGDKALTGAITGLDAISVTVGGQPLRPNWAKAKSIKVSSFDPPIRSVDYTLKTSLNDQTLAQTSGTFDFTGNIPDNSSQDDVLAAGPPDPSDLWGTVRWCAATNRVKLSPEWGGIFQMREPYSEVPSFGGVLVGFNYSLGTDRNRQFIASLQPIYLTSSGTQEGAIIGNPDSPAVALKAKPGYVVTAVHITVRGEIDGLKLTFCKLNGVSVDMSDSYDSDWIADQTGRLLTTDTGGGLAIGMAGKKADKIGSIQLAVMTPSAGGATPAAPSSSHRHTPVADAGTGTANTPGPAAPLPAAGDATDRPPAQGDPYTRFEQLFATLPPELQPKGKTWYLTPRTNPELNHRVIGQPAVMTAGFAEVKDAQGDDKGIEVTLDAGEINYHDFKFGGQIKAHFPADKADQFKKMRIGDQVTISGKIKEAVLRGGNMTEAYLWLDDCTLKQEPRTPHVVIVDFPRQFGVNCRSTIPHIRVEKGKKERL